MAAICIRYQKNTFSTIGSSGRKYRSTSTLTIRLTSASAHVIAPQYHCHRRPMGRKRDSGARYSLPCLARFIMMATRQSPKAAAKPSPMPDRRPMLLMGV
jgi:hypothetical protein